LNKDFFGKKVNASTAPTSGTESAEYWVQLWISQTADGKKGPANACKTCIKST